MNIRRKISWPNFPNRNSKYNARKVCLDGHVFQSQLEADYYKYLLLIKVRGLKVHPSVELVAGIRYKSDFLFTDGNRDIYVDTKGNATQGGRFPTIKKLWREFGPGVLRVVERGGRDRFVVTKEIHSRLAAKLKSVDGEG